MAEDQQFYIGQKAVIQKEGLVLVLFDPHLGADLPGGKIQVGELDFPAALKREVFEETGLQIVIGEPLKVGYFAFPEVIDGKKPRNAGKKIFLLAYKAVYRSGSLTLSDEHNKFIWVSKHDYKHALKGEEETFAYKTLQDYFAEK